MGRASEPSSSFCRALARAIGFPQLWAPVASAWNSLVRDTAARTNAAAMGMDYGDYEQADDVASPFVIVAASSERAEDGRDLRHECQHGDGSGDGGHYGHDEGVAVADVGQFRGPAPPTALRD